MPNAKRRSNSGVTGLHPECSGADQVPLERLEVPKIKHKAVTFGDWPFIERFGMKET
jgi:hypothetical protein